MARQKSYHLKAAAHLPEKQAKKKAKPNAYFQTVDDVLAYYTKTELDTADQA
ncbi:hypothetical protein [Paenibacillus pinistramenti]|uniref:hypothetical protein n=1 Tax=Paenibacillus pinistramenti TaxID=1768003 RepID=UPI001396B029|nr:hypothetical protein [Paenibacillus pinistramenti]